MLIMEQATARAPRAVDRVVFCSPATRIEPTTAMAEIALVSDISGVWSSGETRRMISRPRKVARTKTYRLSRISGFMRPSLLSCAGGAEHLAPVRHQGPADDLVIEVDAELPVLPEGQHEGGEVPRVQRARVPRHLRGQVEGAADRDAPLGDGLARPGQLAVAASLGGRVDDHRARLHRPDHLRGNEPGGLDAADQRRRDDGVRRGATLGDERRLLPVELRGEIPGVARGVLGA